MNLNTLLSSTFSSKRMKIEDEAHLDSISSPEGANSSSSQSQSHSSFNSHSRSGSPKRKRKSSQRVMIINEGVNNELSVSGAKECWRSIEFKTQQEPATTLDYYNIGSIRLVLVKNEANLNGSGNIKSTLTQLNLLEKYHGLTAIQIQVEDQSIIGSSNKIKFVEEREIKDEEAKELFKNENENGNGSEFQKSKGQNKRVILRKDLVVCKFHNIDAPVLLFGKRHDRSGAKKIFQLEFLKYDAIQKEFTINVNLIASAVIGDPSYDGVATSVYMEKCCKIFEHFFALAPMPTVVGDKEIDFKKDMDRFYAMTKDYHDYERIPEPDSIQPPDLHRAQLLDFQIRAVCWMLKREGVLRVDGEEDSNLKAMLTRKMSVPVSIHQNKVKKSAFYSRPTGEISLKRPEIQPLPTGGILAEEMGLGKTIEMLALILLNQRPIPDELKIEQESCNGDPRPSTSTTTIDFSFLSPQSHSQSSNSKSTYFEDFECQCGLDQTKSTNEIITCTLCNTSHHGGCFGYDPAEIADIQHSQKYVCPFCIAMQAPIPSNATLIVVPESLLQQWEDEIETNLTPNKFGVYPYLGAAKNYLHPELLAKNFIVLTTYEVLRSEINFNNLPKEDQANRDRMRNKGRYIGRPSPLTSIEWWRLCLDEAQMVEEVNCVFAKMVARIPTVHRWCVTGTPLVKSFSDLFGIVAFLGIEPISERMWWDHLIEEPFRRNNTELSSSFFGQIFWRTEKKYVQDQLKLPRQTEVVHTLRFPPVEMHFYKERCKFWSDEYGVSLEESKDKIQLNGKFHLQKQNLRLPFTRLRQICCHPQLDDKMFKYVNVFLEQGAKLTFSSKELLKHLLSAASSELESNYKDYVSTLNALGDFYKIKNEMKFAKEEYQRVIDLAENYRNHFDTSDSELFHAMTNICNNAQTMGMSPTAAKILEYKKNMLRTKLLWAHDNKVEILKNQVLSAGGYNGDSTPVNALRSASSWWNSVLDHIEGVPLHSSKLIPEIMTFWDKDKARRGEAKIESDNANGHKTENANSIADVKDELKNHFELLNSTREELLGEWIRCSNENLFVTLSNSRSCHLGMNASKAMDCSLCQLLLVKIPKYERLLYQGFKTRTFVDSKAEAILKIILNYGKKELKGLGIALEKGMIHIKRIGHWKEEAKLIKNWITAKDKQIVDLNTLQNSAIPFRLRPNPPADNSNSTVEKSSKFVESLEEVDLRIEEEKEKLCKNMHKFEETLKKYLYLQMLQKYGGARYGYLNPDSCGLKECNRELKHKWGHLPCGHPCVCEECLGTDYVLCTNSRCLRSFPKDEIEIIDTMRSNHEIQNWIIETREEIYREPFTKVEAIIRTLFSIIESGMLQNRVVKALVVSTWKPMLEVLQHELFLNHINSVLYTTGKGRRDALQKFKEDGGPEVLLMPLSVASTGLNLTEASHILLVDPIINLAWEQQAIGRIHRLGQKNETYVHRFYVSGTVEEKIKRPELKQISEFEEGNLSVEEVQNLFKN